MFMKAAPPWARKCGKGTLRVEGVATAVLARIAATFPSSHVTETVWSTVLSALENDPDLLLEVSQMEQPKHGYTIDGTPTEVGHNTWSVPFTAYVFQQP